VLSGADLGVRIVSVGGGLRADIVAPRDLTAGVRFSANLTNLTGWTYTQQPPSVTVAIAAGQGNLHARVRRVTSSSNAGDLSWGRRIEQLLDQRQESDTTKLQQVAADAVAQGIGVASLSVKVTDTATAAYGRDYDLGDRVTAHVGLPGAPTAATIVDVIREIAFDVDSTGRETITPAVGTSDAKAILPGPSQRVLASLAAGFAQLTRNQ
jgi:hypothetical protein